MIHTLLHLLVHWSLLGGLALAWIVFIAAGFYAAPFVLGTKLGRVLYALAFLALFAITLGWAVFDAGAARGQTTQKAKDAGAIDSATRAADLAYAANDSNVRTIATLRAANKTFADNALSATTAAESMREAQALTDKAASDLAAAKKIRQEAYRENQAWSDAGVPCAVSDSLRSHPNGCKN